MCFALPGGKGGKPRKALELLDEMVNVHGETENTKGPPILNIYHTFHWTRLAVDATHGTLLYMAQFERGLCLHGVRLPLAMPLNPLVGM